MIVLSFLVMTKRIVLCADDYGQDPAISQGIVTLIQYGRLTATSCMVNTDHWKAHAKLLVPLRNLADIGLHLNLTEGRVLSKQFAAAHGRTFPSLFSLLVKSFFRTLDQKAIEAEFEAQLDRFEEELGTLPDFVDGHHHVIQFPVVRNALMNVYDRRLRSHPSYMRLVKEPLKPWAIFTEFKKFVINAIGANAFHALLEARKIPHNSTFAGVYDFAKSEQYRTLFPQFLREVKDQGLIMCHPARFLSATQDALAKSRALEYQYLMSDHFLIDCKQGGVELTRFNAVSGAARLKAHTV
jgi:hypothetical protein